MAHVHPFKLRVWAARHWKRIAQLGTPLVTFLILNNLYDYFVFPGFLVVFGPIWGAVVAVMCTFLLNGFLFWLYEVMKIDWLQTHLVHELEDKQNKNKIERFVSWLRSEKQTLNDKLLAPFVFVLLSLPIDPVLLAIYTRKKHFEGINAKDWGILITCTASAIFMWLVVWESAILLFKMIITYMF